MKIEVEMDISKQVISLEQAKRLKELGVKLESLFYWVSLKGGMPCLAMKENFDFRTDVEYWRAFTVAELGEMLPPHIVSAFNDFNKWYCYNTSNTVVTDKVFQENTEAEARAAMLIFLLENSLLSIEQKQMI